MLQPSKCPVDRMQSIASLIDRSPVLDVDLSAEEAAKAFADHSGARVFAVCDPRGAVVGLIERTAVDRSVADGRGTRPIRQLMLDSPLVADAGCTAAEAANLLAAHPGRPETLVIMNRGVYAGVCSPRALAQALAAQTAAHEGAVIQDCQRLLEAAEAEFRGQVQGLLAMTDRLTRQHLGPDAAAQVHSIQAASEILLRLTDDARDMLRARQGRLALNLRPQPLRALMDQVQDRWILRARESGVALLISYDGDPHLSAVIDSDRLAQVFDNLIDNALRYTRQGSIEASLRARIDGEQVTLEGGVRDTGSDAGHIRLASGLDGEGASLPLSLTQGILASMDSVIRAESNVGQGATLLFSLTAKVEGEVQAAPDTQAQAQPQTSRGTPHVLVVDDNATNRMVAEALCEMFDCTSETAEDGIEAIECVRNGRFDLILMDIKMPRMDGIAATRAIRALAGPEGQTPIVALTANVDPEDARTYLAAGMCCVVEKPIKPDRLLNAINIAIESAREGMMATDAGRVAAA